MVLMVALQEERSAWTPYLILELCCLAYCSTHASIFQSTATKYGGDVPHEFPGNCLRRTLKVGLLCSVQSFDLIEQRAR